MDSILSDLRYAARKLALTPGFTIVAILTLGLAIGATTTVYSVVDAVLIRPLPFTHPAQLVRVESTAHDGQISDASALDLNDYRAQSRTLAGLVPVKAVSSISVQRDAGATLHLTWARVGAGFFSLLGVEPELGRTFASGEDAPGSPKITILLRRRRGGTLCGRAPRIPAARPAGSAPRPGDRHASIVDPGAGAASHCVGRLARARRAAASLLA
jgi:putative ABC transport system permease protein